MAAFRDLLKKVGPGVVTGAADDDPSGIATYSQAGAQFGLNMLWTVVLTWPLMVAVQSVSARIGRVTGHGLAYNFAKVFPRRFVGLLVGLLFIANTVNIGADLAAMGAAAKLVAGGGPRHLYTLGFALVSLLAIVFVPYHRYVGFLKWLTFSLFTYVGVVFTVQIDWLAVLRGIVLPSFEITAASLTLVVAIFGTTISPYLFFWQSSQEVEEEEAEHAGPLVDHPEQAPAQLTRIGWETWLGMGLSNLVAFFIILTTAVTLHTSGQTDIQTSEQAAAALKPVVGEWSFMLFSLGIIGTGMLAIPVLAGSAAYAVAEVRGWRTGLEQAPRDAMPFYAVLGVAILLGVGIEFTPLDPIKALFWSAVLNGVITVPVMAAMLIVASRPAQMGAFVATVGQRVLGWTATAVMAVAAVAMFVMM